MAKDMWALPTIEEYVQYLWQEWNRQCDESGKAPGSIDDGFREDVMEIMRKAERDGFHPNNFVSRRRDPRSQNYKERR